MRLKRELQTIKNIKKIYAKNSRPLIEENQNINQKYESVYLDNKNKKIDMNLVNEPKKEKESIQQTENNPRIYKPSKIIRNSKPLENSNNIPENNNNININNKPLTIKTNNNINIGNNINIINNNISNSNNSNNENINNIIYKNNMMNNSEIMRDYNVENNQNNEDISEKNMDTINSMRYRKNRILDDMGDINRKFRDKNTSTELRHKKLNKDVYLTDNEIMKDEHYIKRNHIYTRPYKTNYWPFYDFNNNYKNNKGNLILRQDFLNDDNSNKNYSKNYYYNRYINDNNLTNSNANRKMLYNYYYNNDNNRFIDTSTNDYNRFSTNYSYANKPLNHTLNNFYNYKHPMNAKAISTNKYNSKYNNRYNNYYNSINNNERDTIDERPRMKGLAKSMIMDDYRMSLFENNDIRENRMNTSIYNTNRRSKNRIRITKSNNPRIIEYNLDLSDEDNGVEEYPKYFYKKNTNFNRNLRTNNNTTNTILTDYENVVKKKKELQKYHNNYTKNIKPIPNNQFNINSNNYISDISFDNENLLGNNSITKRNKETTDYEVKNIKNDNNLLNTPNFSDNSKTPKRTDFISNARIKTLNININDNNMNDMSEDNSYNRLAANRKQINEMSFTSRDHPRKHSFFNNKNIIEICPIESLYYSGIRTKQKGINGKLIFNNEDELIDYMSKKYEEEKKKKSYFNKKLRFTGFILSKKYKGKNLYEIRIEDDIDKINKQLKDETVIVNEKEVELKFKDDNNNYINNNNEIYNKLIQENKNLKLENENWNKKDTFKNELITRLDKEKMKLYEEIRKLNKEIDELKGVNTKVNKIKYTEDIIQLNDNEENKDNKNYIVENIDKIRIWTVEDEKKNNDNDKLNNEQTNHIINNNNKNNTNNNQFMSNTIKDINDLEKLLNDKIKVEDIINKEENINNIYFDDNNKDIIDNNDLFLDDNLFMQNINHPKINDLVEEENSQNAN